MPAVTANPVYQTVGEARQLSLSDKTMGYLKASAKAALVLLGAALLLAALVHHSLAVGPARAQGDVHQVEVDYQVTSFPAGCPDWMRYQGCEKKAWTCDAEDDFSWGYKCCCETSIWHTPPPVSPAFSSPSASVTKGGVSILRLQKVGNVCLASPEETGSHFTFAPCGDSNTRFKLPPRGAGPIELDDSPGQCLGVKEGGLHNLQVVPCNQASVDQMFQLTNGDKGMLQWSHGGNKCLDSENDSTEKGSKIMLADCVYWPMKPSQVFVLEDAPKKKKGDDDEDEEEEKAVVHPSLFCTSLMLPWTYEVDMLRSHMARNCGIFACDSWAAFSNERVKLKEGSSPDEDVYCDIINGSLKAKIGGKFHTALNTPVFQRYWVRLIEDGRAFKHDWTIKVDPDCVFFPDRLTEMLKNTYGAKGQPDHAVWLNNCQLGLHGPIEVFNAKALRVYADHPDACNEVAEKHGQEDVFLRNCFEALKVPKVDAFNLLLESDWACNERPSAVSQMPPCYDRQVSFHPFKTVDNYFRCYDRAVKMSWTTPLYMNSVPPSPANHHHA